MMVWHASMARDDSKDGEANAWPMPVQCNVTTTTIDNDDNGGHAGDQCPAGRVTIATATTAMRHDSSDCDDVTRA